jgi:hypothetical protein
MEGMEGQVDLREDVSRCSMLDDYRSEDPGPVVEALRQDQVVLVRRVTAERTEIGSAPREWRVLHECERTGIVRTAVKRP